MKDFLIASILSLLYIIMLSSLTYLVISFIILEFNPLEWSKKIRIVFIFLNGFYIGACIKFLLTCSEYK